jgi:hypothetical protein
MYVSYNWLASVLVGHPAGALAIICHCEEIRPYLLMSHILAERVEYMEDTFASVSSEFCAPGGSYFGYSMFPGLMLASSMHTPE